MNLHYYVSRSSNPNIDVVWIVDPKQNDYFIRHVSELRSVFTVWNRDLPMDESGINLDVLGRLTVFRIVLILRFEDLLNETSRYLGGLDEDNL